MRTRRIILTAVTLVLAVVGLAPIVVMFARSLMVDGGFSLEGYRKLLTTEHSWQLLGNSLELALLTALLSTLVGLLLGKTDLPFRRVFVMLFTLPLVIPPYITAVSWANVLGPQGLAASLWGEPTAQVIARLLFGLPGAGAAAKSWSRKRSPFREKLRIRKARLSLPLPVQAVMRVTGRRLMAGSILP